MYLLEFWCLDGYKRAHSPFGTAVHHNGFLHGGQIGPKGVVEE